MISKRDAAAEPANKTFPIRPSNGPDSTRSGSPGRLGRNHAREIGREGHWVASFESVAEWWRRALNGGGVDAQPSLKVFAIDGKEPVRSDRVSRYTRAASR